VSITELNSNNIFGSALSGPGDLAVFRSTNNFITSFCVIISTSLCVFLNDIFYFTHNSELYNYADDNTLPYADTDINKLIETLEEKSIILINWFSINKMKANHEKFQAIAVGKQN